MQRIVGVTALALMLVGGTFTAASAATPTDSSNDTQATTLHLTSRLVDFAQLDLGKRGLSLGDQSVFTDDLLQGGKRIGEDHGTCTITRIAGTGPSTMATSQCLVTAVLSQGQMTVQGAVTSRAQGRPAPFTLAITGGTGAYRTARGEVRVREVSNTQSEITVELIL